MPWSEVDLTILPIDLRRELRGFVEHGRMPPPWIAAVLANDLRGYVDHRVVDHLAVLYLIWRVMEFAPAESYGTPQAVSAWSKRGGLLSRVDPLVGQDP